jgi:hypothetical protein
MVICWKYGNVSKRLEIEWKWTGMELNGMVWHWKEKVEMKNAIW